MILKLHNNYNNLKFLKFGIYKLSIENFENTNLMAL